MGTRHLIAVKADGEYKIAQYGQFDGYLGGQGLTALKFLSSKVRREKLKAALKHCVFISDAEIQAAADKVGSHDGWMTSEQSAAFRKILPYLSRDHGAEILGLVAKSKDRPINLQDSLSFAGDSLFCEFAYVIDFDKNTFEVYKGFNKRPVKYGRFAKIPQVKPGSEYYPIRLRKTYKLDQLPTRDEFLQLM